MKDHVGYPSYFDNPKALNDAFDGVSDACFYGNVLIINYCYCYYFFFYYYYLFIYLNHCVGFKRWISAVGRSWKSFTILGP